MYCKELVNSSGRGNLMTDGGSDHIEFLGSFEALDDPRQQACIRQKSCCCVCAQCLAVR